jgi:hypothetical protein
MPRRVLAVAAAAGLVLAVLTGCRSDPRVAAYLDGVTITEAQVDSMLAETQNAAKNDVQSNPGGNPSAAAPVPTRTAVVALLTTKEITKRVLADKGLSPKPESKAQLAQVFGVPVSTGYVDALAFVQGGIDALAEAVGAGFQASDADVRDVYNRAVASGLEAGTFDQFKDVILQVPSLQPDIAARNELAGGLANAHLTVNPRYAPLEYPVVLLISQQTGQSFVAVPLRLVNGPAGNPVIDTPHSATPEATPAG